MSTIKEALEREFPRYRVHRGERLQGPRTSIWRGSSRVCTGLTTAECELLAKYHNELLDNLIEACELINEVIEGAS